MVILGSYITAYAIRIYIMNYYKNTRPKAGQVGPPDRASAASASPLAPAGSGGDAAVPGPSIRIQASAPVDNNRAFFATEQIAASVTMIFMVVALLLSPRFFPSWMELGQVSEFVSAVSHPMPGWGWAALSGGAFGVVAFFSVFIFMFKGRTATFTGLVNRLTSLVAGTTATLLGWAFFGSKLPSLQNWISLGFVLVAVAFLTRAEKKRTLEMRAAKGM